MDKVLHILHLEDSTFDAELTKRAIRKAGLEFEIRVVETEATFIAALEEFKPDLILSDHSLPGFNSMEAYKIICEKKPGTPFILLTGSVSEQFAVDCLLAGIDDYILKSNLIRLPSSIDRILSKHKIKQEKETIEILHAELKETYKQIAEKNKEITDSINYAKRIQDAVLPHDHHFIEEFNAGFAIYKPSNIVSGDLYWLAKTTTSDGQGLSLKLLAAVDCTGHGVPGAFMSLLVSGLLNETLKNKSINTPGEVLVHLNQKLPLSLNRNNKERICDGLDIAFCAIDIRARIAYFAGANRPLWIIRRNGETPELQEYKGTHASIGLNTPFNQEFEYHTISIQSGDRLYMFTDGVTDQFGGLDEKKMGRQKLQEILLGSNGMDMMKQKAFIEASLTAWRGGIEQTDDMLLLGIEIA